MFKTIDLPPRRARWTRYGIWHAALAVTLVGLLAVIGRDAVAGQQQWGQNRCDCGTKLGRCEAHAAAKGNWITLTVDSSQCALVWYHVNDDPGYRIVTGGRESVEWLGPSAMTSVSATGCQLCVDHGRNRGTATGAGSRTNAPATSDNEAFFAGLLADTEAEADRMRAAQTRPDGNFRDDVDAFDRTYREEQERMAALRDQHFDMAMQMMEQGMQMAMAATSRGSTGGGYSGGGYSGQQTASPGQASGSGCTPLPAACQQAGDQVMRRFQNAPRTCANAVEMQWATAKANRTCANHYSAGPCRDALLKQAAVTESAARANANNCTGSASRGSPTIPHFTMPPRTTVPSEYHGEGLARMRRNNDGTSVHNYPRPANRSGPTRLQTR